jgi:hypothetical protein
MTGRGLGPRFRPRLRRGCAVRRHRPARGAFEALYGPLVGREMGGADNELQAAARTGDTHVEQIPVSSLKRILGDLPPGPLKLGRLAPVGKLSSTKTTNAATICSRQGEGCYPLDAGRRDGHRMKVRISHPGLVAQTGPPLIPDT